ncbi:hypothetical protein FEMY_19530 [Ferrovum myxofaciens]|uniref:Uncharacterized protein n=1 Tax=Ferrovum myxofaciens TaxID=416213 RepID=A0A149VWD8_9PROT|nr:hypothetical protein [Ferrovum myxofaciens]KXW57529.1 hypothetical protein FEMY_19530 [Ferrovum myxofaciens]
MIDGQVSGHMNGSAKQRIGRDGRHVFTTALILAQTGRVINVTTFCETQGAALMGLADGDSVALPQRMALWPDWDGQGNPPTAPWD